MTQTFDIPCYQIDAFTRRAFAGNPAAVCPLDAWLPDETMQAIAAENNLSETAFLVREGEDVRVRWFTPEVEVDLCGHGTLAAAFVLMTIVEPGRDRIRFRSKSGLLEVSRDGDSYTLDFPARPSAPCDAPPGLAQALGCAPREVELARGYVVLLDSADEVRALRPDFGAVAKIGIGKAIVTAPGNGRDSDVDFVSRFFAPGVGIAEDPVTGSAHCILTPFWAARLGKQVLQARQVSKRGGELRCELAGDRVKMSGGAVLVASGTLHLPARAA
jgi:PhzF family phenazine biosynthesis protein